MQNSSMLAFFTQVSHLAERDKLVTMQNPSVLTYLN